MNLELPAPVAREPSLEEKVAFLSAVGAYAGRAGNVIRRETHMSWVFLAGDRVYKLKKPVRFPYLDFSTPNLRQAACRAELDLNRRLAPDIYLGVVPLSITPDGLVLGQMGSPVDWLVVMRRLDENRMLDHLLLDGRLEIWQLEEIAAVLTQFYRHARPAFITPEAHLAGWAKSLAFNRRILLDPQFGLPAGLVRRVDRAQRDFLARHARAFIDLVRARRIVEAHGDLRPEHIWLGERVKIIDCLEFNPSLRMLDPFDEVGYLGLECERLGAKWAGEYLERRIEAALGAAPEALVAFYRCHRATLRARLAIAHLLEPNPRTPEKWPNLARTYLHLAVRDAMRIESLVRMP